MRIDLRLHVVHEISCFLRFLNRQLLVLRPAQCLRADRRLLLRAALATGLIGKLFHHLAQWIAAGQLGTLPVRRQHSREQVCRSKRHFCQGCICGRRLQRQRIFEFVRDFTQFAVAAGCGIALQRMHDPPKGAHNFRIAGVLFELQRFVVQRLQKFLRALEKQFTEFGHALVRLGHKTPSTRW